MSTTTPPKGAESVQDSGQKSRLSTAGALTDETGPQTIHDWLAWILQGLRNSGLLISLLVVCVYFSLAAPYFLTVTNLWVMLRTVAPVGIISVGMTMVIIAGKSIWAWAVGGFSGVFVAWLAISHALPLSLAIACTLLVGIVAGIVAGLLRVYYDVPTFVTTLAS